jgi:FkbM family methyltransferase
MQDYYGKLIDVKYHNQWKHVYYYKNRMYMRDEEFNLKWFELFLKEEPKVIFDFGSFDGGDSLYYKLFLPNCDIYSIEAVPELYEKQKHLEQYGIKIFNYAIYNKTGEIEFYPFFNNEKKCGASGSILKVKESLSKNFGKKIKVRAITIEDFCYIYNIENIDYMHIDVEGVTREVFEGIGNIRPKMLWIEIHNVISRYYGATTVKQLHEILIDKLKYELKFKGSSNSLYVRN